MHTLLQKLNSYNKIGNLNIEPNLIKVTLHKVIIKFYDESRVFKEAVKHNIFKCLMHP